MKTVPNHIRKPDLVERGIFFYRLRAQRKGLRENEKNKLMEKAYADGYGECIDRLILNWAEKKIKRESSRVGRKVIVAEIGGGFGNFYERVEEVIREYYNIEPSELAESSVVSTRALKKNYLHLRASGELIPIADSHVDVVIALASLDHIPNVYRAISEIQRILRPGGAFVFSINNRGSWWKRLLKSSKYLRAREIEVLKDHYILWNSDDAAKRVGRYLHIEKMESKCHCPQIPYIWKYIFKPINFLGERVAPNLGSNLTAVFRKPL
jgi:SAM-dependent methyltransferase